MPTFDPSSLHCADARRGRALIGLGSNLPYRGLAGCDLLAAALAALERLGLAVRCASAGWRSAAWPDPADPPFVNAAAELAADTRSPQEVYAMLAAVEAEFGRERRARFAPRTLDLDLLDLDGRCEIAGGVEVPHSRLHERAFVLAPLAEIAPDWRHPRLRRSAADLLAELPAAGLARIGGASLLERGEIPGRDAP